MGLDAWSARVVDKILRRKETRDAGVLPPSGTPSTGAGAMEVLP